MRTEPPWTRRPWRGHGFCGRPCPQIPDSLGNCQETLNPSASHKGKPKSPSRPLTTFSKAVWWKIDSGHLVDSIAHETMWFH